jgi:hypothetical protein
MLRISQQQFDALSQATEAHYRGRLVTDLRRELGAYVSDLTDAELARFVEQLLHEARGLGFVTEGEIAAFARPCVVYGSLAHLDPLFEPMFYAALTGVGARRRLSAAGVSAATAEVLCAEFSRRSGTQLVADLAGVFLGGVHPVLEPAEALEFFPERARRLPSGALEAHLIVSAREADRLNLTDPEARRIHRDVALLLGACFARDPLYPWAIAAFDAETTDMRRISRLRAALKLIASKAIPGN